MHATYPETTTMAKSKPAPKGRFTTKEFTTITFRCDPEIVAMVDDLSRKEMRPRATMINLLLRAGLEPKPAANQ